MTKKQRKEHIEGLKKVIENHGFVLDRWGNYKITTKKYPYDEYRMKMKKINLRFEKKTKAGWFKIFSTSYVTINAENLNKYLTMRLVN